MSNHIPLSESYYLLLMPLSKCWVTKHIQTVSLISVKTILLASVILRMWSKYCQFLKINIKSLFRTFSLSNGKFVNSKLLRRVNHFGSHRISDTRKIYFLRMMIEQQIGSALSFRSGIHICCPSGKNIELKSTYA